MGSGGSDSQPQAAMGAGAAVLTFAAPGGEIRWLSMMVSMGFPKDTDTILNDYCELCSIII